MDSKIKEIVELEEAARRIREGTANLPVVKRSLDELSNESLAEDILAAIDQPPFSRSPLDGYAFRAEESAGATPEKPVYLKVIDKICAGEEKHLVVHHGEAVRLMTGARIPEGANAVIRQEDTDYGKERVALYHSLEPYDNYCFQGEDFKKGSLLFKKGSILNFAAIGVIAGNGMREVSVVRKPEVVVISTGDELQSPGESLGQGKIYDCNRFLLLARLRELGIRCWGVQVSDDFCMVTRELQRQLSWADAVITTGGVSVGEKDIMKEVLQKLEAEILFWGVKMKPGTPSKFALVNGKPVLTLSGNPFAALAVFELLGRPMLNALMASDAYELRRTKAILKNGFGKSSPGRRLIRGKYEDGSVWNPSGNSSGQIASLVECNCLIDLPAGSGPVAPDSKVEIWLF